METGDRVLNVIVSRFTDSMYDTDLWPAGFLYKIMLIEKTPKKQRNCLQRQKVTWTEQLLAVKGFSRLPEYF